MNKNTAHTFEPRSLQPILVLVFMALAACGGPATGSSAQSLETFWCYNVPAESLLEGLSDVATERMNRSAFQESGIYCGAERPAEATGEALLPIYVDRKLRTLEFEGGMDVGSDSIVVRIAGLDAGLWTENKRVYNLSDRPWSGWQVAMANADVIMPSRVPADSGWVSADGVASAIHPSGFHASVNPNLNAVYFGTSNGPNGEHGVHIQPGEFIEKRWSFVVKPAIGSGGYAVLSHTRQSVDSKNGR